MRGLPGLLPGLPPPPRPRPWPAHQVQVVMQIIFRLFHQTVIKPRSIRVQLRHPAQLHSQSNLKSLNSGKLLNCRIKIAGVVKLKEASWIKFVVIYTRKMKLMQVAKLKLLVHLMMMNGFTKRSAWKLRIISVKFNQLNLLR